MQIEQLIYLVEVAKTRSISLAAQNLFVSQPAISMSLKNLEKELNTTLFTRTKSGIILTNTGELLANEAKDMLVLFERFEKDVQNLLRESHEPVQGELVIEAVPNVFYSFLPNTLKYFMQKYRNIKITLIEKNSIDILADLIREECDLGIMVCMDNRLEEYPQIIFKSFFNAQEYVLLNRSHPLANHKFLKIKDLTPYSFAVHGFSKKDRGAIDVFFSDISPAYQPDIALLCSNMSIIKDNISCTENIALISHLLVDVFTADSDQLIAIPLLNHPKLVMRGAYLKDSKSKMLIELFFHELQTYY